MFSSNNYSTSVIITVLFLRRMVLSPVYVSSAGTPAGVNYGEVRNRLLSVKGVKAVHNLHIWALTMNQAVLSAHVAIGEKDISLWFGVLLADILNYKSTK